MINIFNIHKQNSETFYNYATGKKLSLIRQRLYKALIALFMTFLFFEISSGTFSTVVAIYSILVGFSFSILFFLLSIELENADDEKNLEIKKIKQKINKLLKELFYNVSYFNLLAVCLIFFSLLSFVFSGTSHWFLKIESLNEMFQEYSDEFLVAKLLLRGCYLFTFYYLLINSAYSLLRTTERVSYFFQQKIKLKEPKS